MQMNTVQVDDGLKTFQRAKGAILPLSSCSVSFPILTTSFFSKLSQERVKQAIKVIGILKTAKVTSNLR